MVQGPGFRSSPEGAGKVYGRLPFESVREAQKLSLLTPGGTGEAQTVSMHRMVQQAMQARFEAAGGAAEARRRGAQRAVEAVALLSELLLAAMPGIEDGMACTGVGCTVLHGRDECGTVVDDRCTLGVITWVKWPCMHNCSLHKPIANRRARPGGATVSRRR